MCASTAACLWTAGPANVSTFRALMLFTFTALSAGSQTGKYYGERLGENEPKTGAFVWRGRKERCGLQQRAALSVWHSRWFRYDWHLCALGLPLILSLLVWMRSFHLPHIKTCGWNDRIQTKTGWLKSCNRWLPSYKSLPARSVWARHWQSHLTAWGKGRPCLCSSDPFCPLSYPHSSFPLNPSRFSCLQVALHDAHWNFSILRCSVASWVVVTWDLCSQLLNGCLTNGPFF